MKHWPKWLRVLGWINKGVEMFNGYEEAQRIDEQIGTLLEKNSITQENCKEWLSFARTIRTSTDLISQKAQEVLTGKIQEIVF